MYLFRNRFDCDVAGAGRYRGGVGLTDCFVIHNTEGLSFNSVGTGGRFTKNYGLFGGYSGAAQPRILIRGSNVKEMMAGGDMPLPMSVRELVDGRVIGGEYVFGHPNSEGERCTDGDVFVLARGSGGGYGDALEREPDEVIADWRAGVVSERGANDIFGVVFDRYRLHADVDSDRGSPRGAARRPAGQRPPVRRVHGRVVGAASSRCGAEVLRHVSGAGADRRGARGRRE